MKNLNKKTLMALAAMSISVGVMANSVKPKVVGIILPLEHKAMTEIVNGFKQELANKYSGAVVVEVKNAEHDPNIERAILQQFKAQSVDIVEPVGTAALEMTLATIKTKPVVGIAAEMSQAELNGMHPKHATNVLDEINNNTEIKFMSEVIPNLKKFTLIHSADSQIFAEVKQVISAAKQQGIMVQNLMVQQQSDLYTVSNHIASDSQAIFILKDHPIVNGIATLVKQAQSLHIPVISSDDGSVQGGAVYALGVRESEIGKVAADVTARILNGDPIKNIPIQKLTHYKVFINKVHLHSQHVNKDRLLKAAKDNGYSVVYLKQD